jgi:predicted transcriptional regulator
MNGSNLLVSDYMCLSSTFIYEDDTLYNAIQAMKNFNVDKLSIIKKDFSIRGCIDKAKIQKILKNENIQDIEKTKDLIIKKVLINLNSLITLYPKMKISNAYSAMSCLNISSLPVVNNPWEKKIIGFLWLDDILPIVEKDYLKVPV